LKNESWDPGHAAHQGVVCHPKLAFDMFYLLTKFGNSRFSRQN